MNKKVTGVLLKVILVLIVLIFVIVLLTKRFIYFRPSSKFVSTQENYQEFNHKHINGWTLNSREYPKIIVFCHGRKGNISHCGHKINNLSKLEYNVLVFDYSGYGKSSGIPSEQRLYEDISSILSTIKQDYHPNNIILYGEGIGAAVATYGARRYNINTLILESAVPNIKTVVKRSFLSFLRFIFNDFDVPTYLKGYKGRSLLIHNIDDQEVPYGDIAGLRRMVTKHIPISKGEGIPWREIRRFIEVENS